MKKKKLNFSDLIAGQSFDVETSALGTIYIGYLSTDTFKSLHAFIDKNPNDHHGLIRKLITLVGTTEEPSKENNQPLISVDDAQKVDEDELNQIASILFDSWLYLVEHKPKIKDYSSPAAAYSALLQRIKEEQDKKMTNALEIASGAHLTKAASDALNHAGEIDAALQSLGIGPIAELSNRIEKDYQRVVNQLGLPDTFSESAVGKYFEKAKEERQRLIESVQAINQPLIPNIEPRITEALNLQQNHISASILSDQLAENAISIIERLGLSTHQSWMNALEIANDVSSRLVGQRVDQWQDISDSLAQAALRAQETIERLELSTLSDIDGITDIDVLLRKYDLPPKEKIVEDPKPLIEKVGSAEKKAQANPSKENQLGLRDVLTVIGIIVGTAAIIDSRLTNRKLDKVINSLNKQNQINAELVETLKTQNQPNLGRVHLENTNHRLRIRNEGAPDGKIINHINHQSIVVILDSKNGWYKVIAVIESIEVTGWVLSDCIKTM